MIKIQFYKNDLPRQRNIKLDELHEQFNEMLEKGDVEITISNKRTLKQNASLHKYCELWSKELQNLGITMNQIVMIPTELEITPLIVKECIWKPIQKALFGTKSTTKLEKQKEIEVIVDVINKDFGQKFGIHVEFPSEEYYKNRGGK